MKFLITVIASLIIHTAAQAQYAPQAGINGSTAIHAGSPSFTGWATQCVVQRGYMDIADPGQGLVSSGADANGAGMADMNLVSLGDSGIATLTFASSIYNGPGADFAVFENGFQDPNDMDMAFTELAFVEVSSDGVSYHRFPSHSLTPISPQIPMAGVFMDARQINNLAGKYISMNGTPFDLDELSGIPGLDINHVTHVRLVDVIGAISSLYGSQDSAGHLINDPYPTNIPTGGFDLDAVGVIHMNPSFVEGAERKWFSVYPNPASDQLVISADNKKMSLLLTDIMGKRLFGGVFETNTVVNMNEYAAGIYYLYVEDEKGKRCVERIVKQ
ncbi:MAG TPA: T9SS type A sorting domain-containing protein [Flavipsychrobacter sp.]|nr:T9SS type A sorting domain-containing protein [Flavipsychrobacter sp.]